MMQTLLGALDDSVRSGNLVPKRQTPPEDFLKAEARWLISSCGLPSGWEARLTDDGEIYYVDHNQKSTQWKRPNSV